MKQKIAMKSQQFLSSLNPSTMDFIKPTPNPFAVLEGEDGDATANIKKSLSEKRRAPLPWEQPKKQQQSKKQPVKKENPKPKLPESSPTINGGSNGRDNDAVYKNFPPSRSPSINGGSMKSRKASANKSGRERPKKHEEKNRELSEKVELLTLKEYEQKLLEKKTSLIGDVETRTVDVEKEFGDMKLLVKPKDEEFEMEKKPTANRKTRKTRNRVLSL